MELGNQECEWESDIETNSHSYWFFFLFLFSLLTAKVYIYQTNQVSSKLNRPKPNIRGKNIFEVSIVPFNIHYHSIYVCVCVCTEYTFTHQAKNQTVCFFWNFLIILVLELWMKWKKSQWRNSIQSYSHQQHIHLYERKRGKKGNNV